MFNILILQFRNSRMPMEYLSLRQVRKLQPMLKKPSTNLQFKLRKSMPLLVCLELITTLYYVVCVMMLTILLHFCLPDSFIGFSGRLWRGHHRRVLHRNQQSRWNPHSPFPSLKVVHADLTLMNLDFDFVRCIYWDCRALFGVLGVICSVNVQLLSRSWTSRPPSQ